MDDDIGKCSWFRGERDSFDKRVVREKKEGRKEGKLEISKSNSNWILLDWHYWMMPKERNLACLMIC